MSCDGELWAGTTPTYRVTFRDPDGELEDPDSITAVHRPPSGVEQTYTDDDSNITAVSTGVWQIVLPAAEAGEHVLHVRGGGSSTQAAQTTKFEVRPDGTTTV